MDQKVFIKSSKLQYQENLYLGNPLSYYNVRSYTSTWKNGRQLATVSGAEGTKFAGGDGSGRV